MYDLLVWSDHDGNLAPGIALSWDMSPDGKSWTYVLRAMAFHNADPVTAEDVKFSIERVIRPEANSSGAGAWRGNVESVEVLGPQRVKVNAKRAWSLMNYDASIRSYGEGIVIPKGYFDRVGENGFRSKPVGSGPWVFESEQVGQRIVFQANPVKHPFRPQPRFQRLALLQVPELTTRVAMLRTGEADMAAIGPSSVVSARQANLKILQIPSSVDSAIFFHRVPPGDAGRFPTSKIEVRRALALAVNRQEVIDTILGGLGQRNAHFLDIPGQIGNDPSWQPIPYDPALAKQLLANAGYGSGFNIELHSYNPPLAPWAGQASEAIAGYWGNIGVVTKIVPYDYGTYTSLYRRIPKPAEFTGNAFILTSPNLANPLPSMTAISVSILEANPELAGLIGEASSAVDPKKQALLIQQVSNAQFDSYQFSSFISTSDLWGASARIKGWNAGPAEWLGKALDSVEPQ